MKKFTAFVLTFAILILLVGCQETHPQNTNVLKAWSGKFSEEKLKSAITEYQDNYTNIVSEKDNVSTVSFETGFETTACSVIRLSPTDETDIEVELHGYIDLSVGANCDGTTVTVPINWWYANDDSRINDYFVWSYLVRVKDTFGGDHYYYFRVDYPAHAQKE
ncbi:MAG: hypothetical protein E7603_07905 [Ruminococcaceae bacterium]|nr:hypothetical protein [Oscillospiraceae bacterium]